MQRRLRPLPSPVEIAGERGAAAADAVIRRRQPHLPDNYRISPLATQNKKSVTTLAGHGALGALGVLLCLAGLVALVFGERRWSDGAILPHPDLGAMALYTD